VAASAEAGVDELGGPRPKRLVLPSLLGSVGLFRLSTAETGGLYQLRMGFHGEYSSAEDFLIDGDRNRRLAGGLTLAFSPLKFMEIFTAVLASANRNERVCPKSGNGPCVSEPQRVDPQIIRSFGDLLLGTKLAALVSGPFSAGGELGVRFMSSNQGLAFDGDSTSVWFNGIGTVDFRDSSDLPLRLHANLGYYVDNSQNLQDFSQFRANMLGSKAVSSYAYGIGRSRFRTALAADAPLDRLSPGFALQPFVEYHLEVVTGDADPAFMEFTSPLCKATNKPCSENKDQHWVSLGLRGQWTGGFTLDVGVDIGVKSPGFPYGPALAPFNVIMGLSYPFEFANSPPKVVTKTVTVERVVEKPVAPKEGVIAGKVTNAKGGEPIGGAIIAIVGQSRSRVATDADGSFASKAVAAGTVDVEIQALNFEPQVVKANVIVGQTAEVSAALNPRETKSRVHGRVLDDAGKPVTAATVKITGPDNAELKSDSAGMFSAELQAGAYVARAETAKFPAKEERFDLAAGIDRTLEISFRKGLPGAAPAVAYQNKRLIVRRPISFKMAAGKPTAELLPASQQTLDELADVLAGHPEIKRVRVEAHWDSGPGKPAVDELTKQQAQAVAAYLAKHGVAGDRVQPAGMGANKPRVPNLGPSSRAKNRRVEFYPAN
jgi:outer membrane protein OmpA-like peptidoglycan-associated protein